MFFFNGLRGSAAWLSGNVCSWLKPDTPQRELALVGAEYLTDEEKSQTERDVDKCILDQPVPTPPTTCVPAMKLPEMLLSNVGALPHDAVDLRLVREFATGNGDRGAKSRSKASPIPSPAPGAAPPDQDQDAMPDKWEQSQGLNPNDPADAAADADGDGFTNLEGFLNEQDH